MDVGFPMSILAGQVSASTQDMYARAVSSYLAYAGTKEEALSASTLARWRAFLSAETTYSPNTINRMLSSVKRLMKEAATQRYLSYEVAEEFARVGGVKVKALKERTRDNARIRIDASVMREIASRPDQTTLIGLRDSALLHTLASAGLRVSELTSLTQMQVHRRDGGYQLSIRGKNDEQYRDTPLSLTAFTAISLWLEKRPKESLYIFTHWAGRGTMRITDEPLSETSVWRLVKRYAQECGVIGVKPHDFRRFVGTQLAKTNVRYAQKALGHKNLDTTAKHYILDDLPVGITDNLY